MRYIQTYESVGKQIQYSIHDFWEDCIKRNRNLRTTDSFLEKYTDHFIGDGYYDILKDKANRIYDVLKNVEVHDIKMRMTNISDEFEVTTNVSLGMLHFSKNSSGASLRNIEKDVREEFMTTILLEIIQPTLEYGDYKKKYSLRNSSLAKYVHRPSYQCVTFFQNHDIQTLIERNGGYSDRQKMDNYSVDEIIEIYKPGIWINIGARFEDYTSKGKTFTYSEIEKEINNLLPGISNNLDIEEVYYDGFSTKRLKDRLFNLDTEVDDYALKIILQH